MRLLILIIALVPTLSFAQQGTFAEASLRYAIDVLEQVVMLRPSNESYRSMLTKARSVTLDETGRGRRCQEGASAYVRIGGNTIYICSLFNDRLNLDLGRFVILHELDHLTRKSFVGVDRECVADQMAYEILGVVNAPVGPSGYDARCRHERRSQ